MISAAGTSRLPLAHVPSPTVKGLSSRLFNTFEISSCVETMTNTSKLKTHHEIANIINPRVPIAFDILKRYFLKIIRFLLFLLFL